jgi:hypothetical protein
MPAAYLHLDAGFGYWSSQFDPAASSLPLWLNALLLTSPSNAGSAVRSILFSGPRFSLSYRDFP